MFPGWLAVKLAGLAGLTLVHLWLARVVAEMAADRRRHGHRVFRMVNEIPTVLLIVIVMATGVAGWDALLLATNHDAFDDPMLARAAKLTRPTSTAAFICPSPYPWARSPR